MASRTSPSGAPSCSSISARSTRAANAAVKMPKYVPRRGLTRRVRELIAMALEVPVRSMPVVDGVLAIDEHGDGRKGDDAKAVAGQEIAERDAEDVLGVERIGIKRQYNDG